MDGIGRWASSGQVGCKNQMGQLLLSQKWSAPGDSRTGDMGRMARGPAAGLAGGDGGFGVLCFHKGDATSVELPLARGLAGPAGKKEKREEGEDGMG
jgi:hypothetical protein